jgi:hypothetical protein
LVVPIAIALGVALSACSENAKGEPLATSTTPSPGGGSGGPFPTGSEGSKTATSQPVPNSPVKDVQPCSLVSAADATALDARGTGQEQTINNARTCRFTTNSGYKVSVGIYDELGLEDITARGSVQPIANIGKHKAVQWTGGIDTCVISLEVSKTSRVDGAGTANGDSQKSCDLAMKMVNSVEPKLPS